VVVPQGEVVDGDGGEEGEDDGGCDHFRFSFALLLALSKRKGAATRRARQK
jgi:hypothetical protein